MRSLLLGLSLLSACNRLDTQLVELDGRTIEIATAGAGDDTVVFESGLDDDWSGWDKVADRVSEDARVFAYSRPGYGESEATTSPRDPPQIVEELRELLSAQELSPPYVLVGHSNGGGYMELFARAYPDEVSALVLVDPRPLDFLERCEDEGLDMCGISEDTLARQSEVVQSEYTAYKLDPEQSLGALGDFPVRVLTATRHSGASDAWNSLWASMHQDLADEAVAGEQIVFDGAGHYLQVFHPDDVADVIRSVLP